MRIHVNVLSFSVIFDQGAEGRSYKHYKRYPTLDASEYEESQIRLFLHGEFAKMLKRRVDVHPLRSQTPTKIGHFIVEPGHELNSNPNYNLFHRLRTADSLEDFEEASDNLLRAYTETRAVREGAFIIVQATAEGQGSTDPFIFVIKCDLEPTIARISDERELISKVDKAISSRNVKMIQYPHMPEDGMLDDCMIKVHQASHAHYFEDFLKFIVFEQPLNDVIKEKLLSQVQDRIEQTYPDPTDEGRIQEENDAELWSVCETRELQHKWKPEQVKASAEQLLELKPDLDVRVKLESSSVQAKLADFATKFHIAKLGNQYVIVLQGQDLQFDKGFSSIELLQPESLEQLTHRLLAAQKAAEDE